MKLALRMFPAHQVGGPIASLVVAITPRLISDLAILQDLLEAPRTPSLLRLTEVTAQADDVVVYPDYALVRLLVDPRTRPGLQQFNQTMTAMAERDLDLCYAQGQPLWLPRNIKLADDDLGSDNRQLHVAHDGYEFGAKWSVEYAQLRIETTWISLAVLRTMTNIPEGLPETCDT